MNQFLLVAAPGGNPAPLVGLLWALRRTWDVSVTEIHLVLYENSHRYVEGELVGGAEPLEQLRVALGMSEPVAVHEHVVTKWDNRVLEDDISLDDANAFMEHLWHVVRELQEREQHPLIFALVGGRRRTLTVDMATAFQLLARTEDRLVDVRLEPKYADDPHTGFFFPEQLSPSNVHDREGMPVSAADVVVSPVDVRVPRLRQLLRRDDLSTFAGALEAGEEAVERGPLPRIDLASNALGIGDRTIRLSRDQMVWYATLAVARLRDNDDGGWVEVGDISLLAKVEEVCRELWCLEPHELSDAYDFSPASDGQRPGRLAPIRSRLRRRLRDALRGHPHRTLVVPELRVTRGRKVSLERIAVEAECISTKPSILDTLL